MKNAGLGVLQVDFIYVSPRIFCTFAIDSLLKSVNRQIMPSIQADIVQNPWNLEVKLDAGPGYSR